MNVKCIIVDDEPLARKGIKLHLNELEGLDLIGEFNNAIKASDFIIENDVDIIFLDIQMPGMTGVEFLKTIKKYPAVIFTTAYTDYALEAFDLDVIDYLLKPVRFDRFFKAVQKAKEYIKLRDSKSSELSDFTEEYVYIKSDRKYIRLYYNEVTHIQGMKDYVMIHTLEKKYMTAMNIKTILGQLPASIFSRVSKSYIVNIGKIESIETDTINIGDFEIPLGNTYKDSFLQKHIKTKLLKR